MKKFVFAVMCVFAMNWLNAQEVEVSIGTDAGDYSFDYSVPFEEYNMYSISQQIYTAEEMGGNVGSITKVSFKLVYCVDASVRNVDIYMINTDKTSFSGGTDWADVSEADLVYSGEVTYPGPFSGDYGMAWLDIELQTPFNYEGGNLLICCNDRTGANALEAGFAQYNTDESRAILAGSGTEFNVSELYFASGSVRYNNQIKFVVGPANEDPELEPVAPENVVATTIDAYSVNITWDVVTEAISYDVYRNDEFIANVEETEYVDVELQPNTEYCYTVVSVYENGNDSEPSEQACATTLDLTCDAPENLEAMAESTSSISLTWDAVENAMSYNVYEDSELLANVAETSYLVEDLEYNTEYCFTVTAVRGDFESEESNVACTKTLGDGLAEINTSLCIYPNPVENQFFINVNEEISEVAVYNMTGAMVYVTNEVNGNVVNVAELVNGTYIVKVKTVNADYVSRFVKK
ncbi:MAG: T9SS type A sorting domain-containing protein [Bacteroidales bacterium]|nr:T9SS type A sorting domain-containing protein [Bacteroidales bacterium]